LDGRYKRGLKEKNESGWELSSSGGVFLSFIYEKREMSNYKT
jgi:hypothetical protein